MRHAPSIGSQFSIAPPPDTLLVTTDPPSVPPENYVIPSKYLAPPLPFPQA